MKILKKLFGGDTKIHVDEVADSQGRLLGEIINNGSNNFTSTSLSGVTLKKFGHVVTARFISDSSAAISNGTVIGRMPDGYYPNTQYHFNLLATSGTRYRVILEPDGRLISLNGIPVNTQIRDTLTYVI